MILRTDKNALECGEFPVSGGISERGKNTLGVLEVEFTYLKNDVTRPDKH